MPTQHWLLFSSALLVNWVPSLGLAPFSDNPEAIIDYGSGYSFKDAKTLLSPDRDS